MDQWPQYTQLLPGQQPAQRKTKRMRVTLSSGLQASRARSRHSRRTREAVRRPGTVSGLQRGPLPVGPVHGATTFRGGAPPGSSSAATRGSTAPGGRGGSTVCGRLSTARPTDEQGKPPQPRHGDPAEARPAAGAQTRRGHATSAGSGRRASRQAGARPAAGACPRRVQEPGQGAPPRSRHDDPAETRPAAGTHPRRGHATRARTRRRASLQQWR